MNCTPVLSRSLQRTHKTLYDLGNAMENCDEKYYKYIDNVSALSLSSSCEPNIFTKLLVLLLLLLCFFYWP